jgi:uncharacterized pyridoxal phosphate-containing UPF0001 family protein
MDKQGRDLPCFIQVNTGEEPQKAGMPPKEVDQFVKECKDTVGLNIVGLMCIPPVDEAPGEHFALLQRIAARNGLSQISMGMSSDYETAVGFGATPCACRIRDFRIAGLCLNLCPPYCGLKLLLLTII